MPQISEKPNYYENRLSMKKSLQTTTVHGLKFRFQVETLTAVKVITLSVYNF